MIAMIYIWSIFTFSSSFVGDQLSQARQLFLKASENEKECRELMQIDPGVGPQKHILMGYRAAGTMMMSKFIRNPISKLLIFRKGRDMLEDVISLKENNIELNFIRYTIQTNIPGFLGYSENIQSDKKILLSYFQNIQDAHLAKMIRDYLLKHGNLTDAERIQLAPKQK